MNSPDKDLFTIVVIGKDAQYPKKDILIGIGSHLDSEGKETSKLLLRVQKGKNDKEPIRIILDISQSEIFLQALGVSVENAKEIEQLIQNKRCNKKKK